MSETILPDPQPRPLEYQVAIVTGAGRRGGIGAGICEVFAREGVRLVMTDIDGTGLEEARALVADRSGVPERSISAVRADITIDEGRAKIVAEAARLDDGRIDTLVNNAAKVNFGHTLPGDMVPWPSFDEFMDVLKVNVGAAYDISQRVSAKMLDAKLAGSIIMMASVHGHPGVVRVQPHYTASKHAIIGLTGELAATLGPSIRVNAIAPGAIDTDPNATTASLQPPGFMEKMALRRTGTPGEIGQVALFLASSRSSYITGSVIPADGGLIVASSWAADRQYQIRREGQPGSEQFDPRYGLSGS